MVKTLDYYKKLYNDLKVELDKAIQNGDSVTTFNCRGKLIRTIRIMIFKFRDDLSFPPSKYMLDNPAEYKKPGAEVICDSANEYYWNELECLLKCQVDQINDRINENKKADKYSISEETKFKIKRAAVSIRLSKVSSRLGKVSSDCKNNSVGYNFFGTIWSVSKFGLIPIMWVSENVGGIVAAVPGVLIGIPVDVVRKVFGHVINSEENVDFKITKMFGGYLFNKTKEILGKLNDSIIRR